MLNENDLANWYLNIKEDLVHRGYADEIDWQYDRDFHKLTESCFLHEAAWVIINSGFRESVARGLFPRIASAFDYWHSSSAIAPVIEQCRVDALAVFAHQKKIDAICTISLQIASQGFCAFKQALLAGGVALLSSLPYLGPTTSLHLAKNIGMPVCKPDRHLLRLAADLGEPSPHSLCCRIENLLGERIDVVDMVLWRHCVLKSQSSGKSVPTANTSQMAVSMA